MWANRQRANWDSLSSERQQRLLALPDWTANIKHTRWDAAYAVLRNYVAEFGSARVPYDCVYGGIKLGKWAYGQRSAYAEAKLDDDRREKLEALPGWTWNPPRGAAARIR